TPASLKIGTIRKDEGGEFEGRFQEELDKLEIYHEFTLPGTPQYSGIVERVLGLLKVNLVAMLRLIEEGYRPKLWAEAMSMACDMSN
ncbi:unnamed protein product, partial [Ascophyllum nodosum]